MKLRIQGNSLRLRLSQAEVAQLASGATVEEKVEFSPASPLIYAIEPSDEPLSCEFSGDAIRILLPRDEARLWASSEEVGIYGVSAKVSIAIEKDFRCLHDRPGENEADSFPNPASA